MAKMISVSNRTKHDQAGNKTRLNFVSFLSSSFLPIHHLALLVALRLSLSLLHNAKDDKADGEAQLAPRPPPMVWLDDPAYILATADGVKQGPSAHRDNLAPYTCISLVSRGLQGTLSRSLAQSLLAPGLLGMFLAFVVPIGYGVQFLLALSLLATTPRSDDMADGVYWRVTLSTTLSAFPILIWLDGPRPFTGWPTKVESTSASRQFGAICCKSATSMVLSRSGVYYSLARSTRLLGQSMDLWP
jgi:hypothetical protein